MTLQSPNAGGLDQSEAASAVGPSAADPAFDLMAQRVLTSPVGTPPRGSTTGRCCTPTSVRWRA